MASVLIVDDDAVLADTWREVLRLDQHEVVVALSGAEAVELMKARAFDLVITDINMPDGGGMYVSGMTRMLQGHRKIIVVSGYLTSSLAGDTRRDALANLGVRHFLSKPIDIDELRAKVQEALAEA